jgi:hypothetical protein
MELLLELAQEQHLDSHLRLLAHCSAAFEPHLPGVAEVPKVLLAASFAVRVAPSLCVDFL